MHRANGYRVASVAVGVIVYLYRGRVETKADRSTDGLTEVRVTAELQREIQSCTALGVRDRCSWLMTSAAMSRSDARRNDDLRADERHLGITSTIARCRKATLRLRRPARGSQWAMWRESASILPVVANCCWIVPWPYTKRRFCRSRYYGRMDAHISALADAIGEELRGTRIPARIARCAKGSRSAAGRVVLYASWCELTA